MHQHYNKPGLWFLKSGQPLLAMSRIVSEYGVRMSLPMCIYTDAIETIKLEVVSKNSVEDCDYFWAYNASDCSWDKYLNVPSSNFKTILVDGLSYLCHDDDILTKKMIILTDVEAKEFGKSVFIFVSDNILGEAKEFIMQHLIR